MLGFDSIACVAPSNMPSDVFSHIFPPENLLHVSVHLGATRVYAILGVMCLRQDLFTQGLVTRYTNSIFAPICPSVINSELRALSPFHAFVDLFDLRTVLLGSADSIF
jgi:hypothetical protein